MNKESIDRKLDLQVAEATGIKVYYNDWDIKHEMPLYIPSGKPWKTHNMEARPLPSYHKNYGSAFSLLSFFDSLAGFKLERGFTQWWWCGIVFVTGLSTKGEGETAPIAICNAVLKGLEIYPVVALEEIAQEILLDICKKRHLKNWNQRSSKSELIELLNADKQTVNELAEKMAAQAKSRDQ